MKLKEWRRRIAERSDITSYLIHLTKPLQDNENDLKVQEVLLKIIKEKRLCGSTTEKGFIVGKRKAVCLQETPLYSLTQNIFFEQKLRENNKSAKVRYLGFGLLFEKTFIYNNNGRPVIYDKTSEAKGYLPENQWWRIVNFDLSNEDNIIDWSHEREWRVPEELKFELKDISIIVPNKESFKKIVQLCKKENIDIIKETRSIINLGDLFF